MAFKKAGKNFNRREMLGSLMRKQLERTSGSKYTQQIARYHAQNKSNIVTLRLLHRMTNKTSEIPLRVGVMEWIHGNILIEGCAVRKRPAGRRWSSNVGCDNNESEEFLNTWMKMKGERSRRNVGGKPHNWQNTHIGDTILGTTFR